MTNNTTIAQRLSLLCEQLCGTGYGTRTRFAEKLGMSPQVLHQYFSGRRIPGNELQQKLRELGCDVEWLMTGKSYNESHKETIETQISFSLSDSHPQNIKAIKKIVEMLRDAEPQDVKLAEEMLRRLLRQDAETNQRRKRS